VLYPVSWIARLPESAILQLNQALTDRSHLLTENNRLRMLLLLQQQQLQASTEISHENDRLRMLLGVSARISQGRLLVGFVKDHSPAPGRQILRLNKGSQDKVVVGTAVVDAYGLMGQILSTQFQASDVLLITDPMMQVPVRVVRTGARGILQGTGSDELQLKFLPTTSPIREGDMLETSGLDGRYLSGLPVAEVVNVKSQPGSIFWQISAQPVAKLSSSREVLLLLNIDEPPTGEVSP
jgi:rod shape-determining protein MreC